MKKSLIGLLCVSACCLAGCGKGLTVEEACKFADDNWVKITDEKGSKEDVKFKSVTKVKKATGFFEKLGLKDEDVEEKVTAYVCSSLDVAAYGVEGYEFSTFLGKLYADLKLDSKKLLESLEMEGVPEDAIKGSGSGHVEWNKEGFLVKEEMKSDFSINYTLPIIGEVKGELSVTQVTTFSL